MMTMVVPNGLLPGPGGRSTFMVSLGIHKGLFEVFEELNNTTGVASILLGVLTDTRHQ